MSDSNVSRRIELAHPVRGSSLINAVRAVAGTAYYEKVLGNGLLEIGHHNDSWEKDVLVLGDDQNIDPNREYKSVTVSHHEFPDDERLLYNVKEGVVGRKVSEFADQLVAALGN